MDETELSRTFSTLFQRQEKNEKSQEEILGLLHKIEKRLLGDLENDKPGLMDEVRGIRHTMESLESKMCSLEARMAGIEKSNIEGRLNTVEATQKTYNDKVDDIVKKKWIAYGILLACAAFLSKVWDVATYFLHKL